jgi:CRP-like cAMP-binding protein/predicted GNAT family N-acyltransferase
MTMSVRRASSREEQQRIYQFRYRIYVDELRLSPPDADHARRELRDLLDDVASNYALLDQDDVVGSLRVLYLTDVPNPAPLVEKFRLQPALEAFGPAAIGTTSRFMIDPKLRGGRAIFELMAAAYEDMRARGMRLNYGDCSPHLLPFYEHLGYRRYTRAYNDSGYGFKVPILMLMGDRARFDLVRSPLARPAARHPDDAEAREWFEATYRARRWFGSFSTRGQTAFLDLLRSRVALEPLHQVALLRGLEAQEAEGFLAAATTVEAAPGDRIIRQGEPGDALFVLLSGVAEVIHEEEPDEPVAILGAGDCFGEMALLTSEPRSATVVARAPCDLLVLSGPFFQRYIAKHPAVAAKVLLNLSRVLSVRLALARAGVQRHHGDR